LKNSEEEIVQVYNMISNIRELEEDEISKLDELITHFPSTNP